MGQDCSQGGLLPAGEESPGRGGPGFGRSRLGAVVTLCDGSEAVVRGVPCQPLLSQHHL